MPSAQPYDVGDAGWDRIAPQATVGVPLDQVGKVLAAFDVSQGMYRQQLATKIGQEAQATASKIIQEMLEVYPPGANASDVLAVRGLLTMMINYLRSGGEPEIAKQAYLKNRPAKIMYKTKLSTVRNNVKKGAFATPVLQKRTGRSLLKDKLLAATGRTRGEPLFIAGARTSASTVSVGTWISEVLRGADDQIFDEMKNPWSNEITPDRRDEVIIELRKVGSFVDHGRYSLDDDAGLLAFLVKV